MAIKIPFHCSLNKLCRHTPFTLHISLLNNRKDCIPLDYYQPVAETYKNHPLLFLFHQYKHSIKTLLLHLIFKTQ